MKRICLAMSAIVIAMSFIVASAAFAQEATGTIGPEKTTLENLKAAYVGETNANARYLAFAVKADEEGYGKVANLFRAAARAEQVHFERHAREIQALGGKPDTAPETPVVKTTMENLEAAFKGETYESTVMYPKFLKKARKDGLSNAVDSFEDAEAAEGVHARLYRAAIDNLAAWKTPATEFYVCFKCGNIVEEILGPSCPICMEDTKKFITVK